MSVPLRTVAPEVFHDQTKAQVGTRARARCEARSRTTSAFAFCFFHRLPGSWIYVKTMAHVVPAFSPSHTSAGRGGLSTSSACRLATRTRKSRAGRGRGGSAWSGRTPVWRPSSCSEARSASRSAGSPRAGERPIASKGWPRRRAQAESELGVTLPRFRGHLGYAASPPDVEFALVDSDSKRSGLT